VDEDVNQEWDVYLYDRGEGWCRTAALIPTGGGTLASGAYPVMLTFGPGTFTATATVTHTGYYPIRHDPPAGLKATGPFFDVDAVYAGTGERAGPTKPYTITVRYDEEALGSVPDESLTLYTYQGSAWVREPSSTVQTEQSTIVARPSHFSEWATLGEPKHVYLPLILRARYPPDA
jgi:hypothetical protein